MIKRYISLNSLQLSTTVKIKDREQTIVFRGGTIKPIRINGSLITGDPQLQVAIESDSSYGKTFVCDNSLQKPMKKQTKGVSSEKNKLISIDNITSSQMALEWVRKNLSIELNNNTSNRKIKKFVTSQGYDFPNLTD